jgi:hypothetical protein
MISNEKIVNSEVADFFSNTTYSVYTISSSKILWKIQKITIGNVCTFVSIFV